MEDLPAHRDRYRGDFHAQPQLRRAVSRHGLCATDLPRKPARHRGLSGGSGQQALPLGLGAAVARSTLADANEARDWRIYAEFAQRLIVKARGLYVDETWASSWRIRSTPSTPRPSTVPVAVPVGAVSLHQGGREVAHAARSAGIDPRLYPHHRRQGARRQCPRPLLRSRAPSTSWIAAISTSPGCTRSIRRALLCDPRQAKPRCGACIRRRWIATRDSSATRPWP